MRGYSHVTGVVQIVIVFLKENRRDADFEGEACIGQVLCASYCLHLTQVQGLLTEKPEFKNTKLRNRTIKKQKQNKS